MISFPLPLKGTVPFPVGTCWKSKPSAVLVCPQTQARPGPSKGITVFNELEMVQLSFGFGMTFLSKVYPIFCHTGNTVFLKVMIGTNLFSILKTFSFICSYLSVLIVTNVVMH